MNKRDLIANAGKTAPGCKQLTRQICQIIARENRHVGYWHYKKQPVPPKAGKEEPVHMGQGLTRHELSDFVSLIVQQNISLYFESNFAVLGLEQCRKSSKNLERLAIFIMWRWPRTLPRPGCRMKCFRRLRGGTSASAADKY
ncbi:hypothetical protein C8R44DRAFT_741707 [Mycena epipterygia]|nr:hypothetical protein C8R44DRAFT_741707 [Mycena epipterygia]